LGKINSRALSMVLVVAISLSFFSVGYTNRAKAAGSFSTEKPPIAIVQSEPHSESCDKIGLGASLWTNPVEYLLCKFIVVIDKIISPLLRLVCNLTEGMLVQNYDPNIRADYDWSGPNAGKCIIYD